MMNKNKKLRVIIPYELLVNAQKATSKTKYTDPTNCICVSGTAITATNRHLAYVSKVNQRPSIGSDKLVFSLNSKIPKRTRRNLIDQVHITRHHKDGSMLVVDYYSELGELVCCSLATENESGNFPDVEGHFDTTIAKKQTPLASIDFNASYMEMVASMASSVAIDGILSLSFHGEQPLMILKLEAKVKSEYQEWALMAPLSKME